MPKFPKIVKFALIFLATYLILVIAAQATGFRQGFAASFAKWATATYRDYIPGTEASFQPSTKAKEYDMVITMINVNTRAAKMDAARKAGLEQVNLDVGSSNFSVWDYFLLQFIVLFSLVLATPVPWKQKGISFLLGGTVLLLFTFHRFHCSLKYYALESPVLEPSGISPFCEKYVRAVFSMQSIEFIFISTFIIWALATFGKSGLAGNG
ncbi:MAG TPA: hypothetical protein ENJ95_24095 [Bacteroidetes bacterium]|nr:hypothetical protein [Bacteroidota bacterium]